jgi:hypothetical protein
MKLKPGDRVFREGDDEAGWVALVEQRGSTLNPSKVVRCALVAWWKGTASWHPCKHLEKEDDG